MTKTDNLIRATDFAVFLKGCRGEWIPYPESGRIFSTITGDFLKTFMASGYPSLTLSMKHGGQTYKTCIPFHRALWVLCYGIPFSLRAEVDHIDRNKHNNTISNLRLLSKEENTPHKLSYEIAEEIRSRHAQGETQTALAGEFGVSRSSIRQIIYRTSYPHPPEKMYCGRRL